MAHYAFVDENNVVVEVIVGKDENEGDTNWEEHYAQFRDGLRCLRTSYNTYRGVHVNGGTPFRKNYAGIGYTFREDLNAPEGAFVPPKLDESLVLDEEACQWVPPVPMPDDGKNYTWVGYVRQWVEVPPLPQS